MECALCRKEIEKYSQELNSLKIDESLSVDICEECTGKFIKWQQKVFARLFPTSFAKKKYKPD